MQRERSRDTLTSERPVEAPLRWPAERSSDSHQPCADFGRDQMKRCHGSAPSRPRKPFLKQLYACKGYPLSSISPIDTVISSSNGIRLPLPGVLAHDIPIRHWRRHHRLLQQALKQHPA
ncbi:hypothetical protein Ajs_4285 (plasmid) [Acidovorax sp. JS42]|nr:hypothetical protein Ajs_4285 [Acidovorax sp. JS42]